jgi:hypothetical protein
MTNDRDSSADPHPLLHDLAPQNAAEQARVSEVARALGGTGDDTAAVGELLVHRRSLPVLTTQFAESLPAWAAGLRTENVIGPIRDRFGRDIWFDVFRRVRQLRFVRSAGAAPFFALPVLQFGFVRLSKPHTTFQLGAGSFWIATRLLAAAAAGDIYTGLRIKGGTLRFGQPIDISADEVVVPAAVTCEVTLTLDPPAQPSGHGPGRDVRDALFQPPHEVTFRISGTSATVTVGTSAALAIYDERVDLRPMPGAPTYLPVFNRVRVPLAPQAANFTVRNVQSASFRPDGSAPIAGTGWALPAARIAPADLGEAAGVGALMLELHAGLSATWTGQADPATLGSTIIFLDEARLATVSAAAHGYSVAQTPQLPHSIARRGVALTWARTFPLSYFAQATGSEAVFTVAALAASFEKPVDVRGERGAVAAPAAIVIFIETAAARVLWIQGDVPPHGGRGIAFGLNNAVLRSTFPLSFLLLAAYDGTHAAEGFAAIAYDLFDIIPSLPDPYATNARTSPRQGERGGKLISVARWTATSTSVEFILPPNVILPLGMLSDAAEQAVEVALRPAQTRVNVPRDPSGAFLVGLASKQFDPGSESGPAAKAADGVFRFEGQQRLILLDVSTNVSQFGVALRAPADFRSPSLSSTGATQQLIGVKGLDLAVDGRFLALLTLPAVQWEPVECEPVPDDPAFPSRLTFDNSGVPTLVDVPTVNLVPVRPDAALDSIVDNFAGPDPRPTRARFTLPFGIIADAELRKPGGSRGARVTETRPSSADGLRAGRQLRIDAVDPTLAPNLTPALPGFTVQLPNAIPADGSPGPRSILGTSVTNIFNGYVGSGGTNPLVPVTRVDLSGFGESLFSGWNNPADDETEVSKAEFTVMIGRTAHEVVQVRSILLPYRVPVVRTVTLERRNHGVVTRHDSGWVAAGDGEYNFGLASGIVTHPGAVRRMTHVTHIRETGDRVIKSGIEFAAVYYQGDLILDGAARPVPVAHHFGYVKIGTPPLTPAVYAQLINAAGPLCGPLDTTIRIGGGAQAMRLHRVGVGVTQTGSGPEFAMTAWGALVFPGGGDWSVLQAANATAAPQPVPQDEGLPLIRAGAAGGPPPTGPYRFADPADLAHESAPARDYGILHATGTQRAFFRRPKIEHADLSRIVSTERPVIADPYVLATALGPFPPQSDAIPFPSSTFALAVGGGGNYKLELPASTFPAGIGRRTMRQAGSVRSDLDYTASVVTYEVDTAQPVPWRFALTKAKKIMNNPAMGDMITLGVDVASQAGRETTFDDPKLVLGGALGIVQDLLTILEDLGIPAIFRTAMTNEWSLKASLRVPFVDAMGEDLQVPPGDPNPIIKFADTGVTVELAILPNNDSASFEIGGSPMFAIKSIPGLYVVAIIHFKIQLSTADGTSYEVLIGVGLAYELKAGPFDLSGLLAITFFAVWGDTALGYGVGFLVKVSASIEPIVSVELSLEGRLARIIVHPGLPDETVFCAAKLTFAIEVSIFLVLSISIEYETKQVTTVRGSLPESALPDII